MPTTPIDDDAAFLAAARPHWHPVARSKDLDPGHVTSTRLLGEELAVWRSPDGSIGVVEDLCVHRGTRLSLGDVTGDGCVRCPYHAWTFDRAGACTSIPQLPGKPIPARARVAGAQVVEHAGLVWACLAAPGEEARPLPRFDDFEQVGWHTYTGEPMDWASQSSRQIENFLDIAHFSVTHTDVFGNPDVLEVPPHKVWHSDDGWQLGTALTYPAVNAFGEAGPDGRRAETPIDFTYRVELPFTVHLGSAMAGLPYRLLAANQPVDADTCRLFWAMATPEEATMPDELVEASEQLVFHADRRVVETQRPERLPLDLSAELHLGFDRMAVAYRRALGRLGFPVASTPIAA